MRSENTMKKKKSSLPWLYSTPALILVAVIIVFPILYTGYIACTNMNLYHWDNYHLIGLKNFSRALTKVDSGFLSALLVTVIWTAVNMIIQVVVAFFIALGLNVKGLKGARVYKTLLMFPWAMPAYVSILLWRVGMFNTEFGFFNKCLVSIGLGKLNFLATNVPAFISCTVLNLWMALPFMIMMMDGALQSIDESYYESARLDGASSFAQRWYITIPEIKGILAPAVIMTTFTTFKQFDIIYLLTRQKGMLSGASLHTIITYAHENAFVSNNYGLSAAVSVIIFEFIILFSIFILLCFIVLIPILYAFTLSLSSGSGALSSDFSFIPKHPTLQNYADILTKEPFLLWLKNSIILSVGTMVLAMGTAITCAYAFSRYRFKGRMPVLYGLLLLNAFPQILSMFAIFRLLKTLHLLNSYLGLIFIYAGGMCIFSIWNMKGYFDTIPVDIEEAAKIDGASGRQLLMRIVLPLARPAIIVTAVMVLIYVWNEYLFATTFLLNDEKFTLAGGLYQLQSNDYSRSWPLFSSAAILVSIPILIIFFCIQKYMISGLTAGGVKG